MTGGKIKAFAIFEGGGAKGLAHVGALAVAERYQVEFQGVAGSSAGAIVAALVAANYTADELFDPDDPDGKGVLNLDYTQFLGWWRWRAFKVVRWTLGRDRIWLMTVGVGSFYLVVLMATFLLSYVRNLTTKLSSLLGIPDSSLLAPFWVLIPLFILILLSYYYLPLGLFSSQPFESWLDTKLRERVPVAYGEVKRVRFRDLEMPLKIIATDLVKRSSEIFDKDNTPDMSVAEAVAYSISIPGAFLPHSVGESLLTDGGVLSNCPAWVFDDERDAANEVVTTFGFRLFRQPSLKKPKSIFGYIYSLAAVFFGDNQLQFRKIDDLHVVEVSVTNSTLDFDMNASARASLYKQGYADATKSFERFVGPKSVSEMSYVMKVLHDAILVTIKRKRVFLRINVALPIAPTMKRLRVLYTYNMDGDTDDRLIFQIGQGAIGKAWLTGTPLYVDLQKAEQNHAIDWKMTKYQQALVRKDLKSLLSIPIFTEGNWSPTHQADRPIAILSIDSPDNLEDEFRNRLNWNATSELTELFAAATLQIAKEVRR